MERRRQQFEDEKERRTRWMRTVCTEKMQIHHRLKRYNFFHFYLVTETTNVLHAAPITLFTKIKDPHIMIKWKINYADES